MKYKLIAVDVDNTLITSKRELTPRTVAAVKKAVERGVIFTISTGRALPGLKIIMDGLGLKDLPSMAYNGAMILEGEMVVKSLTIPKGVAKRIVEEAQKRGTYLIAWSKNLLYAKEYRKEMDFYKSISKIEPIYVEDFSQIIEEGVTKFLWIDDEENIKKYYVEAKELLGREVNVVPSTAFFLEFMNLNCSKGEGLDEIRLKYGIKKEETVAIGDGVNDIEMLQRAGLSLAVENANEEVKKIADKVIPSCDEEGVAVFLESILS